MPSRWFGEDEHRAENGAELLKTETLALPRRPLHVPPADQMDMNVEHGLPRFRSHVEDSAVAVFDSALASDGGGGQVKASDELCVFRLSFFQATNMLLGNNQNVRGRLRIDVLEGDRVLVFIYFLGGDFAVDDAAEEAVCHSGRSWVSGLNPASPGRPILWSFQFHGPGPRRACGRRSGRGLEPTSRLLDWQTWLLWHCGNGG